MMQIKIMIIFLIVSWLVSACQEKQEEKLEVDEIVLDQEVPVDHRDSLR